MTFSDYLRYRRWLRCNGGPGLSLRVRSCGPNPLLIRADTADINVFHNVFFVGYDAAPTDLGTSPVILDLGCNVGYTVRQFASWHPQSLVVAVEMDKENYLAALRNCQGIAGIKLLHRRVSVAEGSIVYSKQGPDDAYHIGCKQDAMDSTMVVQSITVNQIMNMFSLTHFDCVKMDIEGEEIEIFTDPKSDLSWLEHTSALRIEVHVHEKYNRVNGSVLEQHGFRTWRDTRHKSATLAVRL